MVSKKRVAGNIVEQAKKLGLFDVLQKLVKQGEKLDDITIDKLRTAIKQTDDINWNPNSKPTFGHTFTRHGAGSKTTRDLTGRAARTGTPQGQWLDNDRAAAFMRDNYVPGAPTRTVPIPDGLGHVIMPDGSIVPARSATLVPMKGGVFRDGYPVPENLP